MSLNYRDELIKTIMNRCTVYLVVRGAQIEDGYVEAGRAIDFASILNTITEDIFEGAQALLDEHCKGEDT